jgi:hypothetical protein
MVAGGIKTTENKKYLALIPSGGPNLCWQAGCWVGRGVDWLGQLPQGNIPGQTVHLIIGGPATHYFFWPSRLKNSVTQENIWPLWFIVQYISTFDKNEIYQ